MRTFPRLKFCALALASLILFSGISFAATGDGVVRIKMSIVNNGGITPGDAPGFPATISKPGSYRLTGNLVVPNENTTAIQITSDNVTLDLGGFSITGPTLCTGSPLSCFPTGTGIGIEVVPNNPDRINITIKNGSVSGMGKWGVYARLNSLIESVQVSHSGDRGIQAGASGIVNGCAAIFNGDAGIVGANGSVLSNNVSRSNGGCGILNDIGTVIGNTVSWNDGYGLCLGSSAGYANNSAAQNNNGGVQVNGGVRLGPNVCGSSPCP